MCVHVHIYVYVLCTYIYEMIIKEEVLNLRGSRETRGVGERRLSRNINVAVMYDSLKKLELNEWVKEGMKSKQKSMI